MAFLNGVFTLLVVVVAGFAVSLAGRWASEEEDGRLALVLATPSPRTECCSRTSRHQPWD